MYIKKVLDYSYNYAEYIVSDGIHELICMCISVPLLNGKIPKENMNISKIYVFVSDKILIQKIYKKEKDYIKKNPNNYFGYEIQGHIIDVKKSILQVLGFKISLEYDYPNGLPTTYGEGDLIRLIVDRFDCEIEAC